MKRHHIPHTSHRSRGPARLPRDNSSSPTSLLANAAEDDLTPAIKRQQTGPDKASRDDQAAMAPQDDPQGETMAGQPATSQPPPVQNSRQPQATYMAPAGTTAYPGASSARPSPEPQTSTMNLPSRPSPSPAFASTSSAVMEFTSRTYAPRPTVESYTSEPEISTNTVSAGGRPTTMTFATTSTQIFASIGTLSLVPTSRTVPLFSPSPRPSETGLLKGDGQDPPSSSPTISGTAIAAITLVLSILFIIIVIVLRKRFVKAKQKEERLRRAQLERDYLATKESSIFGGRDQGNTMSEKVDRNPPGLPSGPSWVDDFSHKLPPAPAVQPPSFHGRFSRRGSGWMVLGGDGSPRLGHGESQKMPAVHFADAQKPARGAYDTESRDSTSSSTEEDAVIATASRVSTASVYTTQSGRQPPTSYNSISPYNQPYPQGGLGVINQSPSNQSNASYASYHQDVYRYEPQGATKVNAPVRPGPPTNTLIGAAGSAPDPRGGSRAEGDGFKPGFSSAMSRAREPLKVTKKTGAATRTPSRSYHTSYVAPIEEDEEPSMPNDLSYGQGATNGGGPPRLEAPKLSSSPESALSMGSLMLTPYDEDETILPADPLGDKAGDGGKNGGRGVSPNVGRSLTAKYTAPQPPIVVNNNAPRLTLTSPSGAQLNNLGLTSSASMEEAYPSLAQMNMAQNQPNYRSPTYSIYNMYDGDDESRRAPRRSIVAPKAQR